MISSTIPQIVATTPTVVQPAAASSTYGNWWVSQFRVDASDTNNVKVMAVLKKYTTDPQGNILFSPVDPPVVVQVDQILQRAIVGSPIFDQAIANVVNGLLPNLQTYGQKNGLI